MKRRQFPHMPEDVVRDMFHPFRCDGDVLFGNKKYDLHHAILSKNDVKGMPDSERCKIHSVCNLLWIPNEDNASHANVPSRSEAYKFLCRREGKEKVDAWFKSIVFKSQPFSLESLQ